MDHNKKQNIVIILCAIIIIGLFFDKRNLIRKIDQLNSDLSSLNYRISQEYQDISQRIYDMNKSMLEVEYHVSEVNTRYDNLDYDAGNVEALVSFRLKEVLPNKSYYVSYTPINQRDYIEVPAIQKTSNNFEAKLILSLKHDYKLNVVEKSEDGATKELNMEEAFIYAYNDFQLNVVQRQGYSISEGDKEVILGFEILNQTHGFKSNEIAKVLFSLYYRGSLVYEKDITNQTEPLNFTKHISGGNTSQFGSVTVENASEGTTLEKFYGDDDSYRSVKTYYVLIDKEALVKDYPELEGYMEQLLTYCDYIATVTLNNGNTTVLE